MAQFRSHEIQVVLLFLVKFFQIFAIFRNETNELKSNVFYLFCYPFFCFVFFFAYRSTENLLHRLFVCIAGVADQLQTNFASDLRQILRSVFLMNVSPPPEEIEISISDKSKDSTSDLFEFRASENDVIHENDGGSNQSIYSAEEANPETDSVFEHAIVQLPSSPTIDHSERSASLETEIRITHRPVNVERSQSLGDDTNARPVSLVVTTTTNQIQCLERNGNRGECNDSSIDNHPQTMARVTGNVNNNNTSVNVNNNQLARSVDSSSTLATTTTTIILTTNSRLNRNSHNEQQSQPQQQITETPPRWIPDEEAAQCK